MNRASPDFKSTDWRGRLRTLTKPTAQLPGFDTIAPPVCTGNPVFFSAGLFSCAPCTVCRACPGHTVLNASCSAPWKGGKRAKPGAHSAVYNDKDRAKVEVIYHDPSKPTPVGSIHKPFTQATYVPRASAPKAPVPKAPVPGPPVPKALVSKPPVPKGPVPRAPVPKVLKNSYCFIIFHTHLGFDFCASVLGIGGLSGTCAGGQR